MTIKPFGKRIHIKPEAYKSAFIGEVALVEKGEVLAIGDAVEKIKVGDTVLFTVFGVDKIKLEDQDYYFIMEDDAFILATL